MGLGPLSVMGLADARARAAECRRLLHDGIDPLDAKRTTRAQAALNAAKAMTVAEMAETYITAHRAGWRSPKHAGQWSHTLATYVNPICGSLLVNTIDTAIVLKVLEPIWTTKSVTAVESGAGSKAFLISPRRAVFSRVRTRPGGAVIWTSCCRLPPSSRRSSTTAPYPISRLVTSWSSCALTMRSKRARLSLQF